MATIAHENGGDEVRVSRCRVVRGRRHPNGWHDNDYLFFLLPLSGQHLLSVEGHFRVTLDDGEEHRVLLQDSNLTGDGFSVRALVQDLRPDGSII